MTYREAVLRQYARCNGPRFKNPNQVLTESEVGEIRKLYIMGLPQIQIAKKFGISASHVSNVVNCKRWK